MIVTTTNDLLGYRIVRQVGLVRGITVRSRGVLGNLAGITEVLGYGAAVAAEPVLG